MYLRDITRPEYVTDCNTNTKCIKDRSYIQRKLNIYKKFSQIWHKKCQKYFHISNRFLGKCLLTLSCLKTKSWNKFNHITRTFHLKSRSPSGPISTLVSYDKRWVINSAGMLEHTLNVIFMFLYSCFTTADSKHSSTLNNRTDFLQFSNSGSRIDFQTGPTA